MTFFRSSKQIPVNLEASEDMGVAGVMKELKL
jgi:hypothetical protein